MINCSECVHSYVCADANRIKLMCCGGYQSRHNTVEVVPCKDCKFAVIPYGDEHDGWIECSNIHGRPLFSRDGFCSLGERRTDG